MADEHKLNCACCFESFGIRSTKLIPINSTISNLIQNYVWDTYDLEKEVCPKKICTTCKLHLYSLKRGDTAKLSAWMDSISKVIISQFFFILRKNYTKLSYFIEFDIYNIFNTRIILQNISCMQKLTK